MGIRGLTSFLEEAQATVFHTTKLFNHCLVIDGFSLVYYLYERGKLNIRYGGDYTGYRRVIANFFDNLQKCGIYSVVVFDGAYDENKRTTQIRRLQNYVNELPLLMAEVTSFLILPVLAGEVFQETLEQLDIPYVYTLQDADRDIASIANDIGASVLSSDSDYFILPIKEGYISLSFFEWEKVHCQNDEHYILCQVYKSSYLATRNNLKPSLLPCIPMILGCDWLAARDLTAFTSRFQNPDMLSSHKGKNTREKKFLSIFRWLSKQSSCEDVYEQMKVQLKSKETLVKLKWCLNFYQNLPDTTECQSILKGQMKRCNSNLSSNLKMIRDTCAGKLKSCKIEDEIVLQTRLGNYPTSMFTVHRGSSVVLLPVVVGGDGLQSPHRWSLAVRSATYRLAHTDAITEYSQNGKYFEPRKVLNKANDCNCQVVAQVVASSLNYAKQRNDADAKALRQYLLETLFGCKITYKLRFEAFSNLDSDQSECELFLAATLHWALQSRPPDCMVRAILLALASSTKTSRDLLELFPKYRRSSAKTSSIHRLSEWQSCVKYTFTLNRTLSFPFTPPQINFDCSDILCFAAAILVEGEQFLSKESTPLKDVFSRYKKFQFILQFCHNHKTTEEKKIGQKNFTSSTQARRRRRR